MLIRELLHQDEARSIRLSVWKDGRGNLVMHLQELQREGDGVETYMMFNSWSPTVAREACTRATAKAVLGFYNAHIETARELVRARVASLQEVAS